MHKKMECPICKKKVLFVGVHDDEGNFHGLVGCEYENDPWSGLSYALHHDGWGDCPLCTDGAYSTMGGMLFDTAEDAISALSPPNEPLTEEQLREMDGDPVYIIIDGVDQLKAWVLIEVDEEDVYLTNNLGARSPYKEVRNLYKLKLYRCPPERQEDTDA